MCAHARVLRGPLLGHVYRPVCIDICVAMQYRHMSDQNYLYNSTLDSAVLLSAGMPIPSNRGAVGDADIEVGK